MLWLRSGISIFRLDRRAQPQEADQRNGYSILVTFLPDFLLLDYHPPDFLISCECHSGTSSLLSIYFVSTRPSPNTLYVQVNLTNFNSTSVRVQFSRTQLRRRESQPRACRTTQIDRELSSKYRQIFSPNHRTKSCISRVGRSSTRISNYTGASVSPLATSTRRHPLCDSNISSSAPNCSSLRTNDSKPELTIYDGKISSRGQVPS